MVLFTKLLTATPFLNVLPSILSMVLFTKLLTDRKDIDNIT